jgi:hypothetical protein
MLAHLMTMRFSYTRERTAHPIPSLGGQLKRPRPLVLVGISGPIGTVARRSLLDTGSDDTVFPEPIAPLIGVDLSQAPVLQITAAGGASFPVRYALVSLRLTDGQEQRIWPAMVGFTSAPLRRGLLGYAGCLQFFTATFEGEHQWVELTVNALYPGN